MGTTNSKIKRAKAPSAKAKNKAAKRVWRAINSQAEDRKNGYLIEKTFCGQGFCRDCEEWSRKARYEGTKWTLLVTDCDACGEATIETRGIVGSPVLASQRRAWLYGARAEEVRLETEALFVRKA